MAQFNIKMKGTDVVVDTVIADNAEEILDDYDYSEEFFDIEKAS